MFKWNFTAVNFFHGTLGAVGTDVLGGPFRCDFFFLAIRVFYVFASRTAEDVGPYGCMVSFDL